jgi:hypothetical protein
MRHRAALVLLTVWVVFTPAARAQDCNGNGVPDSTDIANMTSLDCDSNGVPDECQPPVMLVFEIQASMFSTPQAEAVLDVRAASASLDLLSGVPQVMPIGTAMYNATAVDQPPTSAGHTITQFTLNDVGPFFDSANTQEFTYTRTSQNYSLVLLEGSILTLEFPDCAYVVEMKPLGGAMSATPPDPGEDPGAIQMDLMAEFTLILDCPADSSGDRVVNVMDLLAMLAAWGPCPGCPEDVNGDGTVNVTDLLQLLAAWGACP